jgi:integrase
LAHLRSADKIFFTDSRDISLRVLRQRWFDEETQPPKRHPQLPTVLSAEEITRILDATRNLKHWTILATFYATGMRCNELRLLKVEDIDSKRILIHIRNGKGQTPRHPT